MSHEYYSELWLITKDDLDKLLQLDNEVQFAKPTKIKEIGLNRILPMYLRYRDMVRRLIVCYDQIAQTQKRELIKQVLDCAIGRLLEYKRELVTLGATDYWWPDNLMIQLKFTPDDITIPTPVAYTADRRAYLDKRKKFIDEIIENANKPAKPVQEEEETIKTSSSSMLDVSRTPSRMRQRKTRLKTGETSKIGLAAFMESPEDKAAKEARELAKKVFNESILLIQSHDRARRDRCIGSRAKRWYDIKQKALGGELQLKKIDKSTRVRAATIIQKTWRGYIARKRLAKRDNCVEALLSMTIPSWRPHAIFDKDKETFEHRLSLQPPYAQRTEEITNEERARVHRIRGPGLMEDIHDELHEWFVIWYDELGFFDVFPVAEAGGSILVATGQTFTPQEYLWDKYQKEKAAQKGKGKEKSKEELAEAKREAKAKAKENAAKEKAKGWRMPASKTLPGFAEAQEDFIQHWSLRDESGNPKQNDYVDLITERLCYELQLEMREIVDELMRHELAKLTDALMKDHADDEEPLEVPVQEKAKKKKGKKKKKDPLGALNVEDLFTELVTEGVIRNYPSAHLSDFQGDFCYQNYEAQLEYRNANYQIGEIKEMVMEYCILPIGSKEVHTVAPLTRSVCIIGLPLAGKSTLTNAICTELGAMLFDLTPSVLVGKYVGNKKQDKLMKMVDKLARIYAPSVIYIDGGEKPWWKKVPKEEQYTNPKRLAKFLPKFVKGIKAGDQILFLTTSAEPYNAAKPFIKIHNKFIIIPMTDYGTLYLLYKELLMKYHGVDRNFDVSCLAKVSLGMPIDFIRKVVEKVMTVKRRITLKIKPLQQQEFMEHLMWYEGLNPKELEKYKKFEVTTPLGKRRAKMLAEEKAEHDKLLAMAAKQKKRK